MTKLVTTESSRMNLAERKGNEMAGRGCTYMLMRTTIIVSRSGSEVEGIQGYSSETR